MSQPIIRGIQAVGAVDILYRYNSGTASGGKKNPLSAAAGMPEVETGDNGINVAGFKLDQEFLRANPQIASSIVQPLLGGGGIALTNNNRTGTLVLNCSKVAIPDATGGYMSVSTTGITGGIGVTGASKDSKYYDLVSLAQQQQAQPGGDSVGATLLVSFKFCGNICNVQFEGCTVAAVDPLGLAGNSVPDYQVSFNYLNWGVNYSASGALIGVVDQGGTWSATTATNGA